MSRLHTFLDGLKVVDVSFYLPGPFASLLLADMGAEVLKVEPPSGDAMMQMGPRDAAGHAVFYEAVNAGKSVRRMDLKQQDQRAEFLCLVERFDVLIEGFRPGVMRRLGLDYPVLREINPGLVFCSLSGYGAEGPLAQAAGHDSNYLANAGVLYRNGQTGPMFFDPPLADVSGSLFTVIAILGALRAREADGQGCEIDLGLADTAMPLQIFPIAAYGGTGTAPDRGGYYLNGGAAYYQVYRTRDDRHIAVGAIETKFWAGFCSAAGRPEWIARRTEAMPQHALTAEVAGLIATMTLDECMARFGPADCCVSPVLELGEAIGSPHHKGRDLVRRAADGVLQALFPARINGAPPSARPKLRQAAQPHETRSHEEA